MTKKSGKGNIGKHRKQRKSYKPSKSLVKKYMEKDATKATVSRKLIKFDREERREYVNGFKKRREVRKEKAKVEEYEMNKKAKNNVRQMKRDYVQNIVKKDDSDDDTPDEQKNKINAVSPSVIECTTASVEIKPIDLQSEQFITGSEFASKQDIMNSKAKAMTKPAGSALHQSLLKEYVAKRKRSSLNRRKNKKKYIKV